MNGIDILLQQSIIAAFFWTLTAQYTQQKWRLFTSFFGKKYGPIVAIALYSLAWLQCLVMVGFTLKSSWTMPAALPLGTLVLAGAIYLLFKDKTTPFGLHGTHLFLKRMRLHTPYILFLLGIGFTTGSIGIFLGAITYSTCALIHATLLGRLLR